MDYITAKEAAEKWHVSARRIQVLCAQGKIKGITHLGDVWAIPKDAEKPTDGRIKKR